MCSDCAAMDKIFLWVLLVVVTVAGGRRHSPKFPKSVDDAESMEIERVICSRDHDTERNLIMEKSNCGKPKEVFISLRPLSKTQEVTPSAVWVNRCVGLCDFSPKASCIPTETTIRYIPVRIYDQITEKESCSVYPVEEHVSCACCGLSQEKCGAHKTFNARKCSCQCPNPEERRHCLKKRNMKWSRSRCACESRRIFGHASVL